METIKEQLDDLEEKLQKIKWRAARPCDPDVNRNIDDIYRGHQQLYNIHRTSQEFRNRVIDLLSKYLNVCFELYGFYPGQEAYE